MPLFEFGDAEASERPADQSIGGAYKLWQAASLVQALLEVAHPLGKRHALHQSHGGEVDAVGDVTDGPDAGHVGAAVLVHLGSKGQGSGFEPWGLRLGIMQGSRGCSREGCGRMK